jgi:Carboxypeptidase regulatory-like domain
MQLGTIVLAGVCGVVGLVAGRASAPTGPIIIAAAPPPVAPVIVVAPIPVVGDPERADEIDDGDGTDVAEVLATLNERASATPTPAGEVLGRITDWHDEPAVGCTVVAVSPNLAGEQVVITDEHGDYDITKLPPGYYSLTMYYNDNTFVRTDIALREIEPTHFDIALSSPSTREHYSPPAVEPEQEIVIISGVAPTDLDTDITFSGSVALENGFE